MNRIRVHIFAVALITVLAVSAPLSHGQEPEQAPPAAEQTADAPEKEKLAAAGEELRAQLERLDSEWSQAGQAYRTAKGEEKAILWAQMRSKREELVKSLKALDAHIGKLEEAGLDAKAEKQLAERLLGRVAEGLQRSIEQAQERIDGLREERSSAAAEEVAAVDKELQERGTALDEDLATYLEITDLMQARGMEAESELAFLDETLQNRAEHLSGVLQFLTGERETAARTAPGASEDEKKAQAAEVAALDERIRAAAAHLSATVEVMKERGLETAAYKQLLIESTGEITQDIFETEVAFGLLQGWLESGRDWVVENGPRWFFKIIVFVLILLAFKFLAGIAKRLMRRAVTTSRVNLSKLLQEQIVSFVGKVVMFLGLLVALSQLGIQLGPILAGLGIAGFIIGFALQDTLSNFAAGMMILVYRPYDVGDAVEAGGVMGTVKAMNLVSTTIATWDNQKLVVPNSKIWGDVIRNITAEPQRRVDMTFGIAYADDVDHAERVLRDIIKSHELVLEDPEPVVRLHSLGESSVDFIVRPWAKTGDYWTVYWDVTRAVKKRFDEEGISIPFPQRDVHLIQQAPAAT